MISDIMTVSVGILSIGDMGMGIARLLKANSYRVLTVAAGRRNVYSIFMCTYIRISMLIVFIVKIP